MFGSLFSYGGKNATQKTEILTIKFDKFEFKNQLIINAFLWIKKHLI